MSLFDFDAFTGDYPVAVSKERYTEQEAVEIAKRELGVDDVNIFDGYVHYGFGTDPDDPCAKPRNSWWAHNTRQILPAEALRKLRCEV